MTYRVRALRPAMRRLREEGKTLKEIAEALNLGVTTVRANLIAGERYAPLRKQYPGWTEEEDEILIKGRNPLYDDEGNMIRPGLTGHALTDLIPTRAHGTVLNRLHVLRGKRKKGERIVR